MGEAESCFVERQLGAVLELELAELVVVVREQPNPLEWQYATVLV